jgi:hypothetical protein
MRFIIDATARLLFLASQNEGLSALTLFQKVMINLDPMAMGVNFQRKVYSRWLVYHGTLHFSGV